MVWGALLFELLLCVSSGSILLLFLFVYLFLTVFGVVCHLSHFPSTPLPHSPLLSLTFTFTHILQSPFPPMPFYSLFPSLLYSLLSHHISSYLFFSPTSFLSVSHRYISDTQPPFFFLSLFSLISSTPLTPTHASPPPLPLQHRGGICAPGR